MRRRALLLPVLAGALALAPAAPLRAAGVRIEVRADWFAPSDAIFKEIYGGGVMYGAEASLAVRGGLAAWIGGSLYHKSGRLTLTQERTTIEVFPVGAGLKYVVAVGRADLYAGAGLTYVHFNETNPIGAVDTARLGYVLKGGAGVRLDRNLFLDVYVDYARCRMRPANVRIDVGGLHVGAGLGVLF